MEVESRKTLLAFRTCPIQSNPSGFSAAYLKFEVKFEVWSLSLLINGH